MANLLVKTTKEGYDNGGILTAIIVCIIMIGLIFGIIVRSYSNSDGALERMLDCIVPDDTTDFILADVGYLPLVRHPNQADNSSK